MEGITEITSKIMDDLKETMKHTIEEVWLVKMPELIDIYKQRMEKQLQPLLSAIEKKVIQDLQVANMEIPDISIPTKPKEEENENQVEEIKKKMQDAAAAAAATTKQPGLQQSSIVVVPGNQDHGLISQVMNTVKELLTRQLDLKIKELVDARVSHFELTLQSELPPKLTEITEDHLSKTLIAMLSKAKVAAASSSPATKPQQLPTTKNGGLAVKSRKHAIKKFIAKPKTSTMKFRLY